MEYIRLGNSELNVSRICLGCMGFGVPDDHHPWTISEDEAYKIVKRALELGINFFDTAMGYSGGTSEEYLGRIIKKLTKRDNVILATKFLPRTKDEIINGVDGKTHVLNCLDLSLKRLDTDYIDLYICHMWDYHTPIEEIMEGLNEAVSLGKVRAIGISNCYAWQLVKANNIAEKNGWAKFVSLQGHYNLIFREEEREMVPCCKDLNVALTPYSPLASGLLVKPANEITKRRQLDHISKGKYGNTKEQDEIIIKRVVEVAKRHGYTNTQVALAWLLTKVASPIVGATSIKHVEEAVEAIGVTLSNDEISYLEELYVPHKLVGVMQFNH